MLRLPRSPLFIAEIGVNHDGDLEKAKRLTAASAQAGVDIVKFQIFNPDLVFSPNAPLAKYQAVNTRTDTSALAMIRPLELQEASLTALAKHCESYGVEFLATAFDFPSFDLALSLGIKRIKVPSGEINNLQFLRYMAASGLPVLISTGMANMDEIRRAVDLFISEGYSREEITLLQCTTSYPAPAEDLNLNAIVSLRNTFEVETGFSDHSVGNIAPILATSLGASVIEKHITESASDIGPDHAASLPVDLLPELLDQIHVAALALGDGNKRLMPSEMDNVAVARRGIYARRDIAVGKKIEEEDLIALRPEHQLSVDNLDSLLGQKASRAYAKFEPFEA